MRTKRHHLDIVLNALEADLPHLLEKQDQPQALAMIAGDIRAAAMPEDGEYIGARLLQVLQRAGSGGR